MSARGVTRRYRRLTVLQDAGLDLKEGEAVALVGPNGAGKTTLLSILAGVSAPSAGAQRTPRGWPSGCWSGRT
jgi:ABC-type multidrug transport system ATPase subunit